MSFILEHWDILCLLVAIIIIIVVARGTRRDSNVEVLARPVVDEKITRMVDQTYHRLEEVARLNSVKLDRMQNSIIFNRGGDFMQITFKPDGIQLYKLYGMDKHYEFNQYEEVIMTAILSIKHSN